MALTLTNVIALVPSCPTQRCRNAANGHSRIMALCSPRSVRYTVQRYMSDVSSSSSSSSNPSTDNSIVTIQVSKPFGMMLEEIETIRGGVLVQDVDGTTGSALPYRDQIIGRQLMKINDKDVSRYDFMEMMNYIAKIPKTDTVTMEFQIPKQPLPTGTPVIITVLTGSNTDATTATPINAKVGDNLRQTLLSNNIDVYQGMQKLSNCGGAGQCTTCAFDFIHDEGEWVERSDYESSKLKKFPTARLTCLNTIQGPATIRKTQR
jgi:ferredoxin